jgi:hypothetical protein
MTAPAPVVRRDDLSRVALYRPMPTTRRFEEMTLELRESEDDRLDGRDHHRVTVPSVRSINPRTSAAASSSCASAVRWASAATLTAPAGRLG